MKKFICMTLIFNSLLAMESENEELDRARITACFELGEHYFLGKGGEKDFVQAQHYYETSALQEIDVEVKTWSLMRLGAIHYHAKPPTQNFTRAGEFFEKCICQKVELESQGVKPDCAKGRKKLQTVISVKANAHLEAHAWAYCYLAIIYHFGYGVPQDYLIKKNI